MRLARIAIYPIKSARGVALERAWLEPRGLRNDRRWMLVDDAGRFVSQRELPALARPFAPDHIPQIRQPNSHEELGSPSRATSCRIGARSAPCPWSGAYR